MGNLCSSSVKYRPGPANSRPNNYIVMHNLAGRDYPQPFYVDFDDEWSLDQQLRYYNMIGSKFSEQASNINLPINTN